MCFEFEALYWAKLAEEEEEDRKRRDAEQNAGPADKMEPQQSAYDEEPVTA